MTQGAVKPPRSEIAAPNWGDGTTIDIGDIGRSGGVQGPQRKYVAGTTLDSTFARVDVRHVSFHRHTGGNPVFEDVGGRKVTINDARDVGAKRWGSLVSLTDTQRVAVLKDIYDPALVKDGNAAAGVVKWIRYHSTNDNGMHIWRIVSIYSSVWKLEADGSIPRGYLPLGYFLYLHPLTGGPEDYVNAESGDYSPIIARPDGFIFDPSGGRQG